MRIIACIVIVFISILKNEVIGQNFSKGYVAEKLVDGLNPVTMTIDHHGQIWIAEKQGRVMIVNEKGTLNNDPFIQLTVDEFNERGLLGIALHPNFDIQPYVYLYYTVVGENRNRVSRFRANGDLAVPNSEEILLELDTLRGSIHNAGAMVFDNDGLLYIATGEAGFSPNAQDMTNLNGKILRIHDDGTIPEDNPFYNILDGKLRSIWSIGHRNPFNLFYDPKMDILYSSDVGAGDYEEINIIEKGMNYGWPIIEGPMTDQIPPEQYAEPYFYYDHNEGCAIVGLSGIINDQSSFYYEMNGSILYADYCRGYINYLKNGNPDSVKNIAFELDRPLGITYHENEDAIYFLTRAGLGGGSQVDNTSTQEGQLWKLTFTGDGAPRIFLDPEDKMISIGEAATFNIGAIGEDSLRFIWVLNDSLQESGPSLELIGSERLIGENKLFCIVENELGSDTSNVAIFTVTANQRPEANIQIFPSSFRYNAGDTIFYSGKILDLEDGIIPKNQYSWSVDFHHDEHTHPFITDISGVDTGYFVVPTFGEPSTNTWIRIYLNGEDSEGLKVETYVEAFPNINSLHIYANDSAFVNIDGALRMLPYDMPSIVNMQRTIVVPEKQIIGDKVLVFNSWSDGSVSLMKDLKIGNTLDTLGISFKRSSLGTGSGLFAEFFNKTEAIIGEKPVLDSIVPGLDFNLATNSPIPGIIGVDNFSIRLRGYIEPVFTEEYILYLVSDDGARLWIDDELVIDEWFPHATMESKVKLNFEAGKRYKIRIDYFEQGGNATLRLLWSSPFTPKEVVPARQLYPLEFGSLHGRIWNDIDRNGSINEGEPYLPGVDVVLLDKKNHVLDYTQTNKDGFFAFRNQEAATYRILIIPNAGFQGFDFGYGLNDKGYSIYFRINANQIFETRFGIYNIVSNTNDYNIYRITSYPNPVEDMLIIENDEKRFNAVEIFDITGKLVKYQKVKQGRNLINCSTFESGLYIIRGWSPEGMFTSKIIVN